MVAIVFLVFLMLWMLVGIFCVWVAAILGCRWGKRPGLVAATFLLGPVALFLGLVVLGSLGKPMVPSRGEIQGDYEIDRTFYAGPQADWQHATYAMEITEDEVVVRDARTETVWRHEIEWTGWSKYRWGFAGDERKHHMVQGGPSIVREAFGYYYVFESQLYGEVVFRKKKGIRWWLWLSVGVVIVLLPALSGRGEKVLVKLPPECEADEASR